MVITDTLNGRTVEDIRRNEDGSVTIYCDSGHILTLEVVGGVIQARPQPILFAGVEVIQPASTRLNILAAFQGLMVKYVHYDDIGCLIFVCEPIGKSIGHREIRITHTNGLVDELPPVSAIISLPSLAVAGAQGR
jgi:hypothetical protein